MHGDVTVSSSAVPEGAAKEEPRLVGGYLLLVS